MEYGSLTILWICLGVFAALIIIAVILTFILCRKAKKSKDKDINHERKYSAAIIENFQDLGQFHWSYSRYTREEMFNNDYDTPWAHVLRNGPIYDAGSSMNRPWIVGKRMNPIYDGSNCSTLQSIYRYDEKKWKPMGGFYDFEDGKLDNMKLDMIDKFGFENGALQPGDVDVHKRSEYLPAAVNERGSVVSPCDVMAIRTRERTDSELTDPTEDPLLLVRMNRKRTSLVVNEVERQKKSRTGDFYAKNQKKLENYEKRMQQTVCPVETVAFEY